MELYQRITEIKRIKRLSSVEMAEQVGSTTRHITDITSGRCKSPKPELLGAIVEKLNINPYWLLTGKGSMEDEVCYNIPILSMAELLLYNPDKEIPVPQAHSGVFPSHMVLDVPSWLREYSTDLRAFRVFHGMLSPTLVSGDIAICQATGWLGNGIYLYKCRGELLLSYLHWTDRGFLTGYQLPLVLTEEAECRQDLEPIGPIRSVLKGVRDFP